MRLMLVPVPMKTAPPPAPTAVPFGARTGVQYAVLSAPGMLPVRFVSGSEVELIVRSLLTYPVTFATKE